MKRIFLFFSFTFLITTSAHANGNLYFNVPFKNIEIKPASKIYVIYDFDPRQETLACSTSSQTDAVTSIEWNYNEASRKIDLPVILKNEARFEGHYADPNGRLAITNEYGSSEANGSIFVSCEYHKMLI